MRRIALFVASVLTFFGIVGTTGTAFAETSTAYPVLVNTLPNGDWQNTYNTVEMYGWCYDQSTDQSYWGTCTNGYDGIDQATYGWEDNCFKPDCGQIDVTGYGVSADKRSDLHFIGGYYSYSYFDPTTGRSIYDGGSWTDSKRVLPFFETVTVNNKNYTLQLTSATTYYNRDGLPLQVTPACNDTTNPCKGGGGMK